MHQNSWIDSDTLDLHLRWFIISFSSSFWLLPLFPSLQHPWFLLALASAKILTILGPVAPSLTLYSTILLLPSTSLFAYSITTPLKCPILFSFASFIWTPYIAHHHALVCSQSAYFELQSHHLDPYLGYFLYPAWIILNVQNNGVIMSHNFSELFWSNFI